MIAGTPCNALSFLPWPVSLFGCLPFCSGESDGQLDRAFTWAGKQAECIRLCVGRGVQRSTCMAHPGESIRIKCECRRRVKGF
jgi:hypothetical protein